MKAIIRAYINQNQCARFISFLPSFQIYSVHFVTLFFSQTDFFLNFLHFQRRSIATYKTFLFSNVDTVDFFISILSIVVF